MQRLYASVLGATSHYSVLIYSSFLGSLLDWVLWSDMKVLIKYLGNVQEKPHDKTSQRYKASKPEQHCDIMSRTVVMSRTVITPDSLFSLGERFRKSIVLF